MTVYEKIYETLDTLRNIHINDTCNGRRVSLDVTMAITAIEQLEKRRWIPVSERLPDKELEKVINEKGEHATLAVIVTEIIGDKRNVRECYYGKLFGRNIFLADDSKILSPVAWMLLPEEYKGA